MRGETINLGSMHLKWRLSHIRGYLELGMVADAGAELQQIPLSAANDDEVLAVQVEYLHRVKGWPLLRKVAAELVERHPENPSWWISLAYATRRAVSLRAAETLLLEAERRHPKEATIQFNLGCYACQQGDLEEARRRIKSAIALDKHFRAMAKTDPDLAPLWEKQKA